VVPLEHHVHYQHREVKQWHVHQQQGWVERRALLKAALLKPLRKKRKRGWRMADPLESMGTELNPLTIPDTLNVTVKMSIDKNETHGHIIVTGRCPVKFRREKRASGRVDTLHLLTEVQSLVALILSLEWVEILAKRPSLTDWDQFIRVTAQEIFDGKGREGEQGIRIAQLLR